MVLAGGSGFLGRSLARALEARGYEPVILTRSPRPGPTREVAWDGKTVGPWCSEIEGAAAVVNLAGRSVDCRYTPENRREILASRLDSVRVLGEALRQCASPPPVWIQAVSLAILGNSGDSPRDENSPPGSGFSVDVCRQWEAACAEQHLPATRMVLLRIGFALGRDGGALDKLARLTRWGLGGSVGTGQQYVSWLHIEDLDALVLRAIEDPSMHGVYNATGPSPVTNAEFMRTLRHVLHRPWSPPVPAWAVRLGARLMGTEAELALSGRRGLPRRLQEEGFVFRHTDLSRALKDLYGKT
ncbi:Cell division inhibitor [Cystobacter fuscus DSM 2262]|uniref:Cell division inhibitor n=1 Tax=Cystobacter fuscus (strain ATCC 25194 / DSM 2262 / NBRC 100088 / M29) TaxID=1242864 RepID=S9Q8Z7_CYSF2|nr:Cell division inhibitor [Cystobacter fuscus DSM 2262]